MQNRKVCLGIVCNVTARLRGSRKESICFRQHCAKQLDPGIKTCACEDAGHHWMNVWRYVCWHKCWARNKGCFAVMRSAHAVTTSAVALAMGSVLINWACSESQQL